jgi:hypothetical protein
VIAVYGDIMATGIGGFILLFVVLFKRLVDSENKPLPVKQHAVSFLLHSMPDGLMGPSGVGKGQNFVDVLPGDAAVTSRTQ